jgi:hypothetical protein
MRQVRLDQFVQFSLGHSLKDMYNAGAIALTWMVGGFSGAWPYTKLLTMMYCWFTPSSGISVQRRGSLLGLLDRLGTWSLIDLYVLVMCMLAFNQKIASPTTLSFVPVNFYHFEGVVTPVWGLYGFMFGVVLSLIINYVCLLYHRKSVEVRAAEAAAHQAAQIQRLQPAGQSLAPANALSLDLARKKESLREHVFAGEGLYYRFKFNKQGHLLVVGLISLSVLTTVVGACIDSFEFKVHGLVGVLAELGDPGSSDMRFSLIGSAVSIASQAPARYAGSVGVWSIAIVYLCFALVTPLLLLCNLAAQVTTATGPAPPTATVSLRASLIATARRSGCYR